MLLLLFLCVVSSFILRVPNEEKYIYLLDNEKNLINQSIIVEYDNTFNLDNNVYYGNINNLHLSRFFCCYSSSLVDKKLTNDTNVYSNDNNLNIINLCNTSSFGLSKYFYSFSGLCFKKINLINTYTSFEDTNYIQILNPINLTNLFFGGNIFYNLSFPNYSIVCDNLTSIYQNINTTTNLIIIDKNICYNNNTNITIQNNFSYKNINLNYKINENIITYFNQYNFFNISDEYIIKEKNRGCLIMDDVVCDNFICQINVDCLDDIIKYLNLSLQYNEQYNNEIINPPNPLIVKLDSIKYPFSMNDGFKSVNVVSGT